MRAARLAVLAGTLMAACGLYLRYLRIDEGCFERLTGGDVPSLWQELGSLPRLGTAGALAVLVALAFRGHTGAVDRFGAAFEVLLGVAALTGAVVSIGSAGDDAALVARALEDAAAAGILEGGESASTGFGHWVVLAGAGLVLGAGVWDLVAAWGAPASGEAKAGSGGEGAAHPSSTMRPPSREATRASESTSQP